MGGVLSNLWHYALVYEVTDPVLCSEALEMRRGITEDCCMSYSYSCLQKGDIFLRFTGCALNCERPLQSPLCRSETAKNALDCAKGTLG